MIQHSHCDAMNVYILSCHMHKPLISREKIYFKQLTTTSVDYLE